MTWRKWTAVLAGAAVLAVVVGWPFYVAPRTDEPSNVDVVYVMGPPTDARVALAQDMVEQGLTENVMVSLDPDESGDYAKAAAACDTHTLHGATVICAKPDPFTTRGEARELQAEMAEHGWETAAVITLTPHISRTRMIMNRCEVGEVTVLDSGESLDPWYWAYHYAYQTAGYIKAGILQGC